MFVHNIKYGKNLKGLTLKKMYVEASIINAPIFHRLAWAYISPTSLKRGPLQLVGPGHMEALAIGHLPLVIQPLIICAVM